MQFVEILVFDKFLLVDLFIDINKITGKKSIEITFEFISNLNATQKKAQIELQYH